jgi:hypothetical protein
MTARHAHGGRRLLGKAALEDSAVVANCAMNRERQLAGVNSCARELGFNPMDVLVRWQPSGAQAGPGPGWLDLCCGSGRALIEAARQLRLMSPPRRAEIVGVDLVGAFVRPDEQLAGMDLICGSVLTWEPGRPADGQPTGRAPGRSSARRRLPLRPAPPSDQLHRPAPSPPALHPPRRGRPRWS